jgi:hypothetical protein
MPIDGDGSGTDHILKHIAATVSNLKETVLRVGPHDDERVTLAMYLLDMTLVAVDPSAGEEVFSD